MKAVVCTEPGNLIIEDRTDPIPLKGWVTLKIRRVGLCGTDFHILKVCIHFFSTHVLWVMSYLERF